MEKQQRYKKTKIILGEGSYKTVTKAVDEEEGKEVAYNEVRIKNYETETKAQSSFSKEIALLKTIDHKNVLKIIDYWFSEDNFIFITELMTGGSLSEYIEKNGPLGIKLIRKWAKQILEGLVYLYSQDPPIIHRDIKNDNIFVNAAVGEVKIGDLGLARERRNKRYTIVGTPHFMAREMFEGEGYTEKVDIYAFGMCLIEMATGKRPYTEFTDTEEIYKSVLQGVFPKALQAVVDPCLKSLIVSCLIPTAFRYTSSQCLDHHFFHPDVLCRGTCVPPECVAVYPLLFEPIKEMELSIIAIVDNRITFQILLFETMKFIKFEYDIYVDTVEKVCNELMSERIIEKEGIENFSILLSKGLATVESKMKIGKAHDGIIELNSLEAENMKKRDIVISNSVCAHIKESSQHIEGFSKDELISEVGSSSKKAGLGTATLEEMALIEERMKILSVKQEIERRKEEEISFRLKAKLLQKDASYEPALVITEDCLIDGKQGNRNEGNGEESRLEQNSKAVNKNSNVAECDVIEVNKNGIGYHNAGTNGNNCNFIHANEASSSIGNGSCNSINSNPTIQQKKSALVDDYLACDVEVSKSVKFKNVAKEPTELPEEIVYLQFPNVPNHDPVSPSDFCFNSTSSIPQQLGQTLSKIETVAFSAASGNMSLLDKVPPVSSPPLSSEKITEELAVNDTSLNESYENSKIKYRTNHPIFQFVLDSAAITGRSENTAKGWVKVLKEEHIETVFDLKLMVYEDWEKLPLTVFSCRAMQNMLYGIDGTPLKERQLPLNPKIKDYDNKMKIKDFLVNVCEEINRGELVSIWEDRLLAEDIQTVGELKSLHQEDWNRLGLSVFAFRILKNTILKKGKILIDDPK